jgi:hypothetical protein
VSDGGAPRGPAAPRAAPSHEPPHPSAPARRELLLAALLCAVGAALLFFAPLFGGRCTLAFRIDDPRIDVRPWARPATGPLEPINPIAPDIDGYALPGLMRARELSAGGVGLTDGRGPWWEGRQLLGAPLAGNLPYPLLAPATWLLSALPPIDLLDAALALHTALAAFLAYRAARLLGAGPAAAALGAAGFALSAWAYQRWHSVHEVYTLAWWPGQLAALEWLRRGRAVRGVLEGAAFTGLMLLAGFPQVATALTLGTVVLALLDPGLRRARPLAALGGALLLGAALGAPQLLLSGHVYAQSLRSSAETRAATAARGLPPAALAGALMPEFFGRPSDFSRPDPPAPRMEDWLPHRRWLGDELQNSVVYNALYPGVLVLLLLPAALARGAGARARALAACALLAVGGVLASAHVLPHVPGGAALAAGNLKRFLVVSAACLPLAAALALHAVGTGRMRVPWRTGLLLLALLAAAPLLVARVQDSQAGAFAEALRGQSLRQGLCVAAGLLALALLARAARRGAAAPGEVPRGAAPHAEEPGARDPRGAHGARAAPAALLALPAALLLLDLAPLALAFNPFPEQTEPLPATPALAALAERPGRHVVFGPGPNLLPATAGAVHGLSGVQGISPMPAARTGELLACLEGPLFDPRDPRVCRPLQDSRSLRHPLLDLLGVSTVVHADRTLAERSGLPVLFESEVEGLGALARAGAFPRAFLCGGARVVPDARARLALLAAAGAGAEDARAEDALDLRATVLLEEAPVQPLPERGPFVAASAPEAWRDGGGRHELEVDAPFAGVLVLNEGYDPGWHADVDGRQARVLVADHALVAVELAPGRHRVVFRYVPPGLRAGLVLAAAAALLCVALAAWGVRAARGRGAGGRAGADRYTRPP